MERVKTKDSRGRNSEREKKVGGIGKGWSDRRKVE